MSYPSFDMFSVMLIRYFFLNKAIFHGGREHLHHVLLDKYQNLTVVLLIIYSFNIFIFIVVVLSVVYNTNELLLYCILIMNFIIYFIILIKLQNYKYFKKK